MDFAKELKIGVGLTILFVVVTVFLMTGYYIPTTQLNTRAVPTVQFRTDDSEDDDTPSTTRSTTTTVPTPTNSATSTNGYFATDVAKHNNSNDCWIIIGNGVYSVSNYLYTHPGGANQIIPYCGADATTVFQSVGKHGSSRSQTDLSSVYLGRLK